MVNASNRVVVTGMGVLSPLGLNAASTWEGLVAGKSGIGYITLFDAGNYETKFAGEVKGFDAAVYVSRKDARRMDRFAQMAVAAALQAVEQSKLKIDDSNRNDIGVIIGSGTGGLITLAEQIANLVEKGPDRVSPFLVPMMMADSASAQVSITLGARGPNFCSTSACSSSADALGISYETIKRGDAKAVISGGSESIICPIGMSSFIACKALSTRNDTPQKASRPFDVTRDGFVVGEGAAVLILEDLNYALQRGAPILAEIIAYGATGDAYHITQPSEDGEGAVRAMQIALTKGGLLPEQVDYINAHGTSTQLNDKMETKAIKTVFGEHAKRVPVSSTKSMTGHLLGAAGALEASISVLSIMNQMLPPTINLEQPDPECDLDYVPNTARKANINCVLSNSFGFGGHNSVLAFKKF